MVLTQSGVAGELTDADSGRRFREIDQHVDRAGVLHMYREVGTERTFFALEHPVVG